MYVMIRHYEMAAGSMDDLMHTVDSQFVDRLQAQLDILQYMAIDTGDRTIMTITVFANEEQCHRAEAAATRVREALAEFQVEEIEALTGELMVSRATERVLKPIRH